MLQIAHRICAWLIVALGLIHIGFTPFNYRGLTVGALWFIGSGIALILAGFLNLILLRDAGRDRFVRLLGQIANLSFAALFMLALWLLPEPQVFVGLALFVFATVAAFLAGRDSRRLADSL